jgi:hypothetical protein
VGFVAGAAGCGGGGATSNAQPPPTGGAGGSGGSSPDLGEAPPTPLADADSYFPLGMGSTWTFNIIRNGTPETKQQGIDGTEMLTGDKAAVSAVRLKEDISGDIQLTWFERKGSATVTHRQMENAPDGTLKFDESYTPFDIRLEEAPDRIVVGANYSIDFVIDRTDPQKGNSTKPKTHAFKVVGAGESVTVAAGTFTTLHVRRSDPTDGSFREYWYAKGLGKVKEMDSNGDTEELAAFSGLTPAP